MTTAKQRQYMHDLMTYLLLHEPQVDYPLHDVRGVKDAQTFQLDEPGMRTVIAGGGHLMMDCSEAVTLLCKWTELADPNGLGYSHAGYTGTMLAHLSHYTAAWHANVGALVVFGPATGDHVAVVIEPHPTDPLLWSHGFNGGPITIRLSAEARLHRPPVTFLSIAHLGGER